MLQSINLLLPFLVMCRAALWGCRIIRATSGMFPALMARGLVAGSSISGIFGSLLLLFSAAYLAACTSIVALLLAGFALVMLTFFAVASFGSSKDRRLGSYE